MLLSGLVMFFNTSLVEIFTKLTDYTWGVIFGVGAATVWVSYGRGAKGFIASAGLTADPVFTVHFMYNCALPSGRSWSDSAA
ncbi:transporter [Escherichia coli]|uniref:Transporter n=1 Tax=Escherichia coli TaxID=562 RepID=A0A377JZP3_ECOLX|nr:transporter [Escherichia coli]